MGPEPRRMIRRSNIFVVFLIVILAIHNRDPNVENDPCSLRLADGCGSLHAGWRPSQRRGLAGSLLGTRGQGLESGGIREGWGFRILGVEAV